MIAQQYLGAIGEAKSAALENSSGVFSSTWLALIALNILVLACSSLRCQLHNLICTGVCVIL